MVKKGVCMAVVNIRNKLDRGSGRSQDARQTTRDIPLRK